MDVRLMGVVCVEAFRIFNLVFGKKPLYPTVSSSNSEKTTFGETQILTLTKNTLEILFAVLKEIRQLFRMGRFLELALSLLAAQATRVFGQEVVSCAKAFPLPLAVTNSAFR
jgi:hypothetical protein